MPESPLANFGSAAGMAGHGVARELTAAARPARPIKKKAAWAARAGARFPAGWAVPESPLANFGSVWGMAGVRGSPQRSQCRKRKGHGDAPCAPARQGWAGADAGKKMAPQGNLAGGPGVLRTPGRRPPHRNGGTFGSFSHERTTIIRYVGKKMAAKLSRQVSRKATPAKANKEKSNVRGGAGCGGSGGVRGAGKPARPIKKKTTCVARRGAGLPAE